MSDTIRDALAALVAAWDSEAYNREWGQRMTAAIAAARAALAAPAQGEPQPEDDFVIPCAIDGCKQPSQMPASEYCSLHSAIGTSPTGGEFAPQPAAAPAQGEPQERMGTHWDGCSTEGGPRHYDCAVAAIAALRAENERQAREIARLTKARDEWIGRAQGSRNNTETMIERAERAEAEGEPRQPDNDMVICPACTHQFRAVPVNVQDAIAALRAERDEAHSAVDAWIDLLRASEAECEKLRACLAELVRVHTGPRLNDEGPSYRAVKAARALLDAARAGK